MQDSIEDYIKIAKGEQEEPNRLNKENHITIQRKKECEIRAMKIVEFSIEGKLRPEIFTKCLTFINQSHYQDIVEERAITKLCGYSICGKKIPDMPRKQYYISTKSNKVYDITDRKNFCSNFCYKASLHIKKQIDNGPLWLRKLEDIPEYQLLESAEGGLPGEYVDQGIVKPVVEPTFTSIPVFTEASLQDMVKRENENKREKEKLNKGSFYKKKSSKLLKSTMQTITENSEQVEEEAVIERTKFHNKANSKKSNFRKHEHMFALKTLPVIDENEEKVDVNCITNENNQVNSDCCKSNSKKAKKKGIKAHKVDIEMLIHKVVREWLTLDSYIFIHGESKVKEVLNEKKLSDYFEELNITELQSSQQLKYMNICKRLQLQEMADEKFDNALIGNTKLKPIPNYKKLKEENKDLNVKVKCFYSGVLHENEDRNFPSKINKTNDENDSIGPPAVLPLLDASSQNAMRRKIFLSSINKSLQQLLQSLKVTQYSSLLSDLQALIKTFNLKADNIVFKPVIWNYIAIVLLIILSLRDKNIMNIFEEQQSRMYIDLQLNALPRKVQLIEDIRNILRNIDEFVENFISSKS